MGVLSEIRHLVKQAQLIVPPVYKPKVYQQGAKNIANAVKKSPNAAWGTIGAGAGIAKSIGDRKWTIPIAPMTPMSPVTTVGKDRPEGSWGDYARAGWNAGYNHGDMAAAGMIEGAANSIPFANFEAPTRFADFVRDQKVHGGMDEDVADTMRGRANWAGVGAMALPTMAGWGILGKGMGATGRFAAPIMKANPARVGAIAEKWGPWAVVAGQEAPTVGRMVENGAKTVKDMYANHNAQEAHRKLVGSITPEKRQLYLNKSIDNFSPQSFLAAEGLGVSRDDFDKMFIDRNSLKMNVLRAPQIQRAALMKQYGFEQGDIDRFAGRLAAMIQILDANEADQVGLMNRYGMSGDELGLMYRSVYNNQSQSLN